MKSYFKYFNQNLINEFILNNKLYIDKIELIIEYPDEDRILVIETLYENSDVKVNLYEDDFIVNGLEGTEDGIPKIKVYFTDNSIEEIECWIYKMDKRSYSYIK